MSGFKLQIVSYYLCGGDVNAFVLETDHYVFLIDDGAKSAKAAICQALEKTDLDRKKLMILNTHAHWDHSSLNGYLKERYGATIWGHPKAVELCDKEKQYELVYGRYADFFPGKGVVYWDGPNSGSGISRRGDDSCWNGNRGNISDQFHINRTKSGR